MTRAILTCAGCGSADLRVTAWVYAKTGIVVNSEPPDEQVWCPHCERMIADYYTDEVEEIDPEWWASNGYRCLEPKCVTRDGCDACQLYVCASCAQVRHWTNGGGPDPRCEECYALDPEEHVAIVVPVVVLPELLEALERHAEHRGEPCCGASA